MPEIRFQEGRQKGVFTAEFHRDHPAVLVARSMATRQIPGIHVKPSHDSIVRQLVVTESDEARDIFGQVTQTHELQVLDQLLRFGEQPDLSAFPLDVQKQLTALHHNFVARSFAQQSGIREHKGMEHAAEYRAASRLAAGRRSRSLGELPAFDMGAFIDGVVERVLAERKQEAKFTEELAS